MTARWNPGARARSGVGRRAPRLAFALAFAAALAQPGCRSEEGGLRRLGTVERTAIELVAPAAETIVEIAVDRGQRVTPGETLVRLDATLAEAAVAGEEAALAGARAVRVQAERDFARLARLQGERVASEQELDRARRAREEAAASVRAARARLAAARKRERDLTLVAPVAGVVDQIPFDLGERVPAGSVLAVLLQDQDPWVRVWIPEPHLARIGPGDPAVVEIDGVGGALAGRVLDVAREPEFTPHYALTERDRGHLVYEARVRIEDAPPGLRPGLPAEVTFPTASRVPGGAP